jgi:hypothetical protein
MSSFNSSENIDTRIVPDPGKILAQGKTLKTPKP